MVRQRVLRSAVAALYVVGYLLPAFPSPAYASAEEDMDKIMGPIALYPDALLAQTLTAATCPDQVPEFQKWLGEQTATGSDLQQAAMDAKFDAAFASLALFPDVIKLLAENMEWTKAIGTAYQSDKDAVGASIQRLRTAAQDQGNLESNEQQTVKVENEGSTQTIIIEPANPQVVYVPQYDPVVVYTEPAPSTGGVLLAFGIGIAIGASMSNSYYGYGAWGYGWGGGGAYYHHGPYMPPPYHRYPYPPPVHGYRPPTNVYAPRNTNINIDNSRTNVGNNVGGGRGNGNRGDGNRGGGRGDTKPGAGSSRDQVNGGSPNRGGATAGGGNRNQVNTPTANTRDTSARGSNKSAAAKPASRDLKGDEARGRSNVASSNRSGSASTSMGGYSSGKQTRDASSRGRASASSRSSSSSHSGGGRRR